MLIPSIVRDTPVVVLSSLSRRVNANSQPVNVMASPNGKLIKKGEC